jgi:DNA-binding NarL/FixJ family response regulator
MLNNQINIAIAEDQLLFRECLTANLKKYTDLNIFVEASNGKDLLEQLTASQLVPDVVLMDLNMPEMNGLEATHILKEKFPDTKILVLSVHSEETHVARMVQQGINGYLAKNTKLEEVYQAIKATIQTGFYFNDTVKQVLQSGVLNKRMKINSFENEYTFTTREKEVLELICKEYTTQEIADKLFLSIRTIDGHRNHLLEKTGAKNTAGLVVYALRNQLVELESLK